MFGWLKRLFRRKEAVPTPEEAIERAKAETQQKLTQWNAQLSQYRQLLARLEKSVAAGEAEERELTARIRDLLQKGRQEEARKLILRLESARKRLAGDQELGRMGERQRLAEARERYEKLKLKRDAAGRRVNEWIKELEDLTEYAKQMEIESQILEFFANEAFEIDAMQGMDAAQETLVQSAGRSEAEVSVYGEIDTSQEEAEEKERREHADELLAEFETAPRLEEPVEAGRAIEIESPRG
jgi:hypothetical protein